MCVMYSHHAKIDSERSFAEAELCTELQSPSMLNPGQGSVNKAKPPDPELNSTRPSQVRDKIRPVARAASELASVLSRRRQEVDTKGAFFTKDRKGRSRSSSMISLALLC